MGRKFKEEAMKYLIRLAQPDILLIQETKMEKDSFLHVSAKFLKKGGRTVVSSRGASGGIATLWDDQKHDLVDTKHSPHWILTTLLQKETNTRVRLFNIYVPATYAELFFCWNLIRDEISNLLGNVILAGDLNIILNQAEKRGGSVVRDPIREQFDDLIMEWGLSDIIPAKGKYTWNNKRLGPGHIAGSLDRFLDQDSFLLLGVKPSSKILVFGGSYHKLILLKMRKDQNLGPIPFRFNPLWVSHNDFMKIVAKAWTSSVTRSPFYIWEEKPCRAKRALKKWEKYSETPNNKKR